MNSLRPAWVLGTRHPERRKLDEVWDPALRCSQLRPALSARAGHWTEDPVWVPDTLPCPGPPPPGLGLDPRGRGWCLGPDAFLSELRVAFVLQGDLQQHWGFPHSSTGKEPVCSAGDLGLILGLGRSPGEGNGNPLQYSCLENPMNRGSRQATVHGATKVGLDLVTKPPPPPQEHHDLTMT